MEFGISDSEETKEKDKKKEVEVRKAKEEKLLDSGVTGLIMSSEFIRKQGFRLKKIERPIYVRNINRFFNKEGPIEHTCQDR